MRYRRTRALAGAAVLGGCFAVAHAQQQLDNITIGEQQCTGGALRAPIDPKQIGEPVSAVQIDKVDWHAATERSPAMCVVEGQIMPVDRSATAFPIKFAVGLPASWNRRSIHQGGGGMNGSVPRFAPAASRAGGPGGGGFPGGAPGGGFPGGAPGGAPAAGGFPAGPPGGGAPGTGAPPSDIARGFAVYGSDSGHGQDPKWALNEEAARNFGYAQLKKTHDVAQVLIQRLYGSAPRYRYFIGTSQGGREAITVAQRYPADYDGVAANVPVMQLNGLMAAPPAIRRQEILLERRVPTAKGRAVAAEFMRQCDGLDGLHDGLINDYMQCRAIFNVNDGKGPKNPWATRRCPDNRDPDPADKSEKACLTDGQIKTLEFIFSSQPYLSTHANGVKAFGMWPPSTEVAGPGMGGNALFVDQRFRGQEGAAADARMFNAMGVLGVTGFVLQDLDANPIDFDMARFEKRNREVSTWMDSTSPDLSAFRKRGGKMIVAIGTNDTLASPGAQLDYYAALTKKMGGKLDGFARLYVLPQRGHGLTGNYYTLTGEGKTVAGAPLPSQFDRLAMLQKWVEEGQAPDRTQTVTGQGGTTGLMCSYPQHPHYKGGEPGQAASWICRE